MSFLTITTGNIDCTQINRQTVATTTKTAVTISASHVLTAAELYGGFVVSNAIGGCNVGMPTGVSLTNLFPVAPQVGFSFRVLFALNTAGPLVFTANTGMSPNNAALTPDTTNNNFEVLLIYNGAHTWTFYILGG